jgi:IS30 family transposase
MKRRTWRRLMPATRAELWRRFKAGETLDVIAAALAQPRGSVQKVIEVAGGCAPRNSRARAGVLTLPEREVIARLLAEDESLQAIGRVLGRPASTISREVQRNGGPTHYDAAEAEARAWRRARRPKVSRLASEPRLRHVVAEKLAADWSPAQIAGWLRRTYPETSAMQISAETIYRSLFIQARGTLKKELMAHLRSHPSRRQARAAASRPSRRGQIVGAISISARPASVEDRAVPGHWEGDLLMGARQTVIATLVERQSRYVHLVRVPTKETSVVIDALIREVRRLPGELIATLTWDRGHELQQHHRFTMATDVAVYFCDPQSPWQRGSNENTNGLLRQYFPKGTDLSGYTQRQLDAIARRLNTRPRETLGFRTPAEVLNEAVAPTG